MEKIFGLVHMRIAPGARERFRERALACIAAASRDLTGTTAYEWFIAPDGTEAYVIEIYDGPEAVAVHSRMVGTTVLEVTQLAKFELTFAGEVPEALLARMRERLGRAEYFGPRLQGRLQGKAPGVVGESAGSMIFAVARFAVHPGREQEFRTLAREAFALVQANEPGTLAYEWFLNESGTECLTIDAYRDAAALKAHMLNAGPVMDKILKVVKSESRIYGAVPEPMRARFRPEVGVTFGGEQLGGVM
jgi:quinol monooxygenase YgiN